jgi:hypothetical protein
MIKMNKYNKFNQNLYQFKNMKKIYHLKFKKFNQNKI